MRPPRSESPKSRRPALQTDSLRQRCNDRNTDEIIKFVRDIQFERQPTLLKLHKKEPLPGISKICTKYDTCQLELLNDDTNTNDSDSDILDNEIVYSTQRKALPKIDPVFIDILTCPRRTANTSKDNQILSRSFPAGQVDMYNNNSQTTKIFRQNSFVRHIKTSRKGNGNMGDHRNVLKQLPPLSRDNFPERPSAPLPARTPPNTECRFIEEKPVAYWNCNAVEF